MRFVKIYIYIYNCIAFLFVELPWNYQTGQIGSQDLNATKIKVTKLPTLSLVRIKSKKYAYKEKGYSGTQKHISFPLFIPVAESIYSYINFLQPEKQY